MGTHSKPKYNKYYINTNLKTLSEEESQKLMSKFNFSI